MTKEDTYTNLLQELKAVLSDETDFVARMANTAAMIHEAFDFWWTGFYRVSGNQLVLGPFQGPLACMRIAYGKGVCGSAWQQSQTIIVPDVEQFPGHIACSALSRSEIVVPLIQKGKVVAVLDIDSAELNTFDKTDKFYLEQIAAVALGE